MKLLFLISLSIFANIVPEGTPPGYFGHDEYFTKEGELSIPEKGYDKFKCFRAVKIVRTIMNRTRTLSFRIDKKCRRESTHPAQCQSEFNYLKTVLDGLNRQREIIANVCSIE